MMNECASFDVDVIIATCVRKTLTHRFRIESHDVFVHFDVQTENNSYPLDTSHRQLGPHSQIAHTSRDSRKSS